MVLFSSLPQLKVINDSAKINPTLSDYLQGIVFQIIGNILGARNFIVELRAHS